MRIELLIKVLGRMVIFITQKRMKDKHGANVDGLESAYITFFTKENIFPTQSVLVPVPNHIGHLRRLLNGLHPCLFILTGGNNIDPQSFGSDERLEDLAPRRDKVESYILDFAFAENIPVIGICRGSHFINVYLGGRLTLNLLNHKPGDSHYCQFDGKNYHVNSYHNHGIVQDGLAKELTPIAKTTDGRLIEAFTGSGSGKTGNMRILGVQWHPERSGADTDFFRLLVNRFIKFEKR